MQQNPVSPSYIAAELQARDHWANHGFSEAANSSRNAAEIALRNGDAESWCNMTFFQAESLLAAGQFDECVEVAAALVREPHAGGAQLQARVRILMSKAWQGAGLLDKAAEDARVAIELLVDDADAEVNVTARLALIAALGESGELDEAWTESLNLADVVSVEVNDQLLGNAYWVIGNAAFLTNRVEDGLRYHELAAETFSPARNLEVWARFNNASAAMRLAADVADAATLRCIERAELATDVIGGSKENILLQKLNRGHWNYLAGDPATAVDLLTDVRSGADILPPQVLGEACLLLGRAHHALGAAAKVQLLEAAGYFETAGAQQRADHTRAILTALG
jgi:tetratricopeptide (TPR) repeat protein